MLKSQFLFATVLILATTAINAQSISVTGDHSPSYDGVSNPWIVGGALDIGITGAGSMLIEDGASVDNGFARLGQNSGSSGEVNVTGDNSSWESTAIVVGGLGQGDVHIRDNGSAIVSGPAIVGYQNRGSLNVNGSGTTFTSGGGMDIGASVSGNGILNIDSGANVTTNGVGFLTNSGVAIGGSENVNNGDYSQTTGQANINGPGTVWNIEQDILVGVRGEGIVNVTGGGHLSSNGAQISRFENSSGRISIDGKNSTWNNKGNVELGVLGNAELAITNGGKLETTGEFTLGNVPFQPANPISVEALVSGSNSSLNVHQTLSAGGGTSLRIENSAQVVAADSFIGTGDSFSQASLHVSGIGSQFDSGALLSLGSISTNTNAVLFIDQGGSVLTTNMEMGVGSAPNNVVANIAGIGSTLAISNSLTIGGAFTEFNIFDSAVVDIANKLTIQNGTINLSGGTLSVETLDGVTSRLNMTNTGRLETENIHGILQQNGGVLAPGRSPGLTTITDEYVMNAGSIEFEIEGLLRGTEYDGVDVVGTALLNGLIDVNLTGSFTPELDDSFLLVNSLGGINLSSGYTFDFSDAELAQGLAWDTSQFMDGRITVVASSIPEPGMIGLLALVAFTLALGRTPKFQA